jgi:fido (protein-threonine AMPylation protein)
MAEFYREDFERKHAENAVQKVAFELCDMCNVDPFECGSRYGNMRRCRLLCEKLDKLFEHPT